MLDPTKVDDVQVGFTVKIEKQHTVGEFVTGIVAVIISKANNPKNLFTYFTSRSGLSICFWTFIRSNFIFE